MPREVPSKLRVLVIDDSAYNRRAIEELVQGEPDLVVVGTACDGEEGLKAALTLKPDVITLDLQMPKLDGFGLLRLLMARAPTPVIVLSGYARRADVFRAMELGALDFVAKAARHFSPEAESVRRELLTKIRAVRQLRRAALGPAPARAAAEGVPAREPRLVVIGASTGGPAALQRLLPSLPGDLGLSLVIAQHMPARFTRAFAERLGRRSAYEVGEARDGELLRAGAALVVPGGHHLTVASEAEGLRVRVEPARSGDVYVPSIDALFASAARAAAARTMGLVLTGMGSDGRDGLLALRGAGAATVAESEQSAVIFGMPGEAIAAGAAQRVLALDEMVAALVEFARRP